MANSDNPLKYSNRCFGSLSNTGFKYFDGIEVIGCCSCPNSGRTQFQIFMASDSLLAVHLLSYTGPLSSGFRYSLEALIVHWGWRIASRYI